MAKLGNTPAANRYRGLATGPDSTTSFETQGGIPVDGGNALYRDLSPFTIQLIPPEELLAASTAVESIVNRVNSTSASTTGGFNTIQSFASGDLDSIDAAAASANSLAYDSTVLTALGQNSLVNTDKTVLQQVVADGVILSERGDTSYSTIVDAATAADIAVQLQELVNVPALTLLVNPTTMSINYTKIQSYGSRTRTGYVYEAWGEEQPKMSISGSTGGFVAGLASQAGVDNTTGSDTSSVSGYQWASRRDSAAWQNFMSLYTFYRNNGYIFDTLGRSEAHLFIGAVVITYDQISYVGHFESFDFSFDEATPHRVEFSLEFTISRQYDSAEPPAVVTPLISPTTSLSDPQYTTGLTASRNRNNGALDLFSRSETSEFANDFVDLAQNPIELFRG